MAAYEAFLSIILSPLEWVFFCGQHLSDCVFEGADSDSQESLISRHLASLFG